MGRRWFSNLPLCRRLLIIAMCVMLTASGCASVPDPSDAEAYADFRERNDPIEPLNRGVYRFNRVIDRFFLRPAAGWYRLLIPSPVQSAITNFLRNLRSPVVAANDLLQGEWDRLGNTTSRFAINTTLGVAGFGDPARDWFAIAGHDEDFGQTLAVWGVGEGPFLILPLIGPSNPRDALGLAVDNFLVDPIGVVSWVEGGIWVPISRARTAMTIVDARARNFDALEDIESNTLDPYAALRSFYRQYRIREIAQGRSSDALDLPGFDDDIPDAQ